MFWGHKLIYIILYFVLDYYLGCNKQASTLSRNKIVRSTGTLHCIVEPYNASRLPVHLFRAKLVKVVTFIA